eukprot:TRINITY_DN8530_c0_g1_i1.p1 TRINITY_DN8530_c0_g1~~TRINITY_DN8530_c0_g1_i1.p1  ORF type:complete len:201 (-),score=21.46 TRINITY_DN8530_c0_g1_i1:8-610(-)
MAQSIQEKYLKAETLKKFFSDIDNTQIVLMSTDSYNESQILQKIEQTGMKTELAACAINMSCVGFGNKRYGSVMVKGEVLNIEKILKTCNVLLRNDPSTLLRDDDLTPQRICRFFRENTRDYLKTSKYPTYMFRKYSDRDENFADICFRGAEYLDDLTEEQRNYLLLVTETLDERLNTNVKERVKRVFEAKRGYSVMRVI